MALHTPFPNPPVGWTETPGGLTAAQLDATLRQLPYHRPAFARRRTSGGPGTQTLASAAWSVLSTSTLDAVDIDTHAGLSGSGDATYTVPAGMGGAWCLTAFCTLTALSDGTKMVTMVAVNGARALLMGRGTGGSTDTAGFGGSGILVLSPGDVLRVEVYHNSSNGTTNGSTGYQHFSGFRLL